MWLCKGPSLVTSCCNLFAASRQLSFTSTKSVHCRTLLVIWFLLHFRDKFPDSLLPNKSTTYRLVNCFCYYINSSSGFIKHVEVSKCTHRKIRCLIPTLNTTLFLLSDLSAIYLQTGIFCVIFLSSYIKMSLKRINLFQCYKKVHGFFKAEKVCISY